MSASLKGSVVHRLVHEKIISCYDLEGIVGGSFIVPTHSVRKVLGHRFHIRSESQLDFIKELEGLGLLQIKNKHNIIIFK